MPNGSSIERRLQLSGILLALALVVEAVSLVWVHPAAFLFFLVAGGVLMAAGILVYLYSLLPAGSSSN
jgi:hypothetical protein